MAAPDPIFDTRLLRRRLARALAQGPADILLTRTAEDLVERLETVQRHFGQIADVGTPGPYLARALTTAHPSSHLVSVAPDPPLRSVGEGAGEPRPAKLDTHAPQDARHGSSHAPSTASGGPPPPLHGGGYGIVADLERLPLAPEKFDLIVSALALQSVNDLPGALVQIRRALKPDGLFLGALLGGRTLHELRTVLTEAESELTGGVSPRVAPFADVRDMGGLLQRAGFALPVADSDTLTVRYDNLFALMADLRAMGATNTLVGRSRRPTRREIFLRAGALYQSRFADADGRVRATFEVISLSGWAPHESQQKPAARGSGRVSLADALNDRSRT